jgi:hypothetical protein
MSSPLGMASRLLSEHDTVLPSGSRTSLVLLYSLPLRLLGVLLRVVRRIPSRTIPITTPLETVPPSSPDELVKAREKRETVPQISHGDFNSVAPPEDGKPPHQVLAYALSGGVVDTQIGDAVGAG